MELINKQIGILGIARSGIAAAKKIKEMGGIPFLSELKPEEEIANSQELLAEFQCEFGGHSDRLFNCETIIVSPGIPLTSPVIVKAKSKGIKLISEIEFGYRIKHADSKIIAVTGSNGKSTTVSLIAHLLQVAGYRTLLAGNIGDAFCGFPIEKDAYDYIILELSSFQLDLIDTFRPEVAVLLNITPDHLNRYDSFDHYAMSKFRVFMNQESTDLAVLNLDDFVIKKFEDNVIAKKKYFSLRNVTDSYIANNSNIYFPAGDARFSFSTDILNIRGPHNFANTMSALLAVSGLQIPVEKLLQGLNSFTSLAHRLEFVAEVKGVKFINDSKATNSDSVKYALLSFDKPIRIIMGGSDKGEDFAILNPFLKEYVKKIYLIGSTRKKMLQAFQNILPICEFETFEDCIQTAFRDSDSGDYVVLSPACASYDMFNNFEHRGNEFKRIVNELKND